MVTKKQTFTRGELLYILGCACSEDNSKIGNNINEFIEDCLNEYHNLGK